ncbi:hypothetical protein B0H21DRAFT_826187 [Amylocystis lapponica]|nr:hypothetical protein B0H21DRAFT_826187 [Amylocystis lapponica]
MPTGPSQSGYAAPMFGASVPQAEAHGHGTSTGYSFAAQPGFSPPTPSTHGGALASLPYPITAQHAPASQHPPDPSMGPSFGFNRWTGDPIPGAGSMSSGFPPGPGPARDPSTEARIEQQRRDTINMRVTEQGRILGRTLECWKNLQSVLDAGWSRNTTLGSNHYSTGDQENHRIYDALVERVPFLPDEIKKHGPGSTAQIAKLINNGRKSARHMDVRGFKINIMHWHDFEPALKPTEMQERGFRHPECGRLLCPPMYNYSDPQVAKGLEEQNPRFDIGPANWPAFLWLGEVHNPEDFHAGFLKNEILVSGVKHILHGPSVAIAGDAADQDGGRGTKKSNADHYSITNVTDPLLAYVCMIMRFALSSQKTFGSGGSHGNWPYRAFYTDVLHYLRKDMPVEVHHELMLWWQSRIFPHGETSTNENTYIGPARESTAQKMRSQVRARPTAAAGEGGLAHHATEADVGFQPGMPGGALGDASNTYF